MKEEDIIGDVWLYNQDPTPIIVNWEDIDDMPFLNLKEYVKESISPIRDKNAIELKWTPNDSYETIMEVDIYINNRLVAKLSPESKPGWSKFVTKDGPLARIYK